MNANWPILIGAFIALLLPLPAFYSRKFRYRGLVELDIERRNGSWWHTWKQVFRFPGHWIELLRGALAASAMVATSGVLGDVSEFYLTHAAWARRVLPLVVATASVVLIALLFRSPGKSIAPVTFVSATLLAVLPPAVSLPALLLAVTCSFGFKSLGAYFATLGLVLAPLGLLLDPNRWPSVAGAVLAFAPWVIAFGRHHELVIPVRRPRS